MKMPAKILKMHAKTYEQGSSKIFAENREDLGQNFWNIEKEKDKEKVGGRPAKLNEKKSHIELEREIKKERGHYFFIGRTTWKFCSGGEKMRSASGHRGENERQWKKKKQTNKLSKNTLGSFWKFHVVVVQNNVTEMYKKCAARAELLFR